MLPLAQHSPPGFKHPLVEPWAAAQGTPSANRYKLAAVASSAIARNWQVTPAALAGVMVLPSGTARRRVKNAARSATAARNKARELEKQLAEEPDNEAAEVLSSQLDAARAAGHVKEHIDRRRRRAAWHEARKGRSAKDWRGIWSAHIAGRLG